jgi:1-acyl-sn-glycerol-3-phosphate acyltransferase
LPRGPGSFILEGTPGYANADLDVIADGPMPFRSFAKATRYGATLYDGQGSHYLLDEMRHRATDRFLAEHPELLSDERRVSWETVRRLAQLAAPLDRYFRFRHRGWENVPEGACLFVVNHSIGAIPEILLLLRAWYQNFGDRPARGLAHQVFWQAPAKWAGAEKIGAVLAHPEVARRALARGEALVVFPGGDAETCRPFADRYQVSLGGRSGFAKLAQQTRTPIVPAVLCGSHATYIMLPGAEHFARWARLGRFFGLKAFPLTAGCVGVLTTALTTLLFPPAFPLFGAAWLQSILPLPARIELEVLPPIYPDPGETDEQLAERVRVAMQEAMDRLAAQRKTPWW